MTKPLPESLLVRLSDFVATQLGLHFPRERWRDLERGLGAAAREWGFADARACGEWLLSSPPARRQIESLAGHLTIGETYFFRDKRTFEFLEERLLPELIGARRAADWRLRFWSAGCCTGEEPYSLAILLRKLLPDLSDWRVTILATDINTAFLRKASAGVYGEWSFRETPAWVRERCFRRTAAGRFEILPTFREMVTFAYLNLAEDVYPALLNDTNAMDMILCRNVLMYFAPERAQRALRGFYASLLNGGWLIVSPSETSRMLFSRFSQVNFHNIILYRKEIAAQPAAQRPAPGVFGVSADLMPLAPPVEAESGRSMSSSAPAWEWQAEETPAGASIGTGGEASATPYHEAFAFYQQGRYAEAEARALALVSEKSQEAKPLALLARIHANRGQLAEALAWCERAIAADRLNPAGYYLYAMIQHECGHVEEAAASLRRTLYLDPRFVLAHFALGNLALQRERLEEADKHFENALRLLRAHRPDDLLPESDGLTAGRLREIIRATTRREALA